MNYNLVDILESNEYYYEKEISFSYYFIFVDFFSYIIISFILKSKKRRILILKYKLFLLFILDIIIRIIFINTSHLKTSLPKELLCNLLFSCQFYIILYLLDDFSNKIKSPKDEYIFEYIEPIQVSTYFFFVIFSYDKYFHGFKKLIYLLERLIIIGCLFKIYGYLRNKVYEISFILKYKNPNKESTFYLMEFIVIQPLIIFTFYYILSIGTLFIISPIKKNYINIILIIIKEVGKYLVFLELSIILYSLRKYSFENSKSNFSHEIVKINSNKENN